MGCCSTINIQGSIPISGHIGRKGIIGNENADRVSTATPAERSPGKSPARKLLPPPQNGRRNMRKDIPRAFMATNVVVEDEQILDKYRGVSLFTLANSYMDVSIHCDSG